ncbi:multicopper oxidase family protein [Pseudoduganella namucuonensis]|uniref:Multicopper oxidase CueO n=1 Tax=Pseudoduganella namucuonensis TaxID=1035707 RepID=A0A1I7FKB2_9BURK|nr:multicopper oxidase domain-containing protein [Pseudoduganella namucuonensis]SFU36595.1 suppressor of ftsI/bilirubin oxidase [Pseudoduganella namucuonensis]
MKPTRRHFLMGSGALLVPPALYFWGGRLQDAGAAARDLDASLRRRYANPLRPPGEQGWFAPVRVGAVSRLSAVPLSRNLRGNRGTPMWVYQAEVQGRTLINPTLIGRAGDEVALRFDNRIEQPSIIHWHGFTNDGKNDGGGMRIAEPGASHDYAWRIRNGAGLNWYHPHPHENAGEQVWRGMSGLFLVEDEASDRLARELNVAFGKTDIPLVIQDRELERSGAMHYTASEKRKFHGMGGNEILVNLTRFPFIELPRRWVRFRMLNGSNARLYKLAFRQGQASLPFALLGADGALLEAPLEIKELFLAPAQRIDVAIDLRQAAVGDVWLQTLRFDPMHNEMGMMAGMGEMEGMAAGAGAGARHVHGARGEGADEPVLRIQVKEDHSANGRLPHRIGAAAAPPRVGAAERDFLLDHDGEGHWRINGKTFHQAHDAFRLRNGAREIWRIRNADASMPHPMHLHGFSFSVLSRENSPAQIKPLVLDRQGRTAQDTGQVDTVLVWPGETVRVAVDFSMPFRGEQRYMFHCHNLEHEDLGMMLGFSVAG